MKTKFLLFTLALSYSLGFAKTPVKQDYNYILHGHIIGQTDGIVVLHKSINYKLVEDTAKIRKGNFTFKGYINEPITASIGNNHETIWLDKGMMHITINVNGKSKPILKGSKTQDENDLLDSLIKNKNRQERTNIQKQFIKSHPHSYISAHSLYALTVNDELELNQNISMFNNLHLQVQNSGWGKDIKEVLGKKAKNRIGAKAPDFNAKEYSKYWLANGGKDTLCLADLKGKVVLLDFWAFFCGPCIGTFPKLKEIYNKYHQKGLEIVAVNSDFQNNTTEWENAIIKHGIENWHHVNVAENFTPTTIRATDIFANYHVQGIPRKILIDRNGIIQGNWEGTDEETEKEVEGKIENLINQ